MKSITKFFAVLMAAAMMVGIMQMPVKAEAASPTTFKVVYDTANSRWAFQENGGTWSSDFTVLTGHFAAGDILVIEGTSTAPMIDVTVNARVSELAVSGTSANIKANGGVDLFYVVNNGTGIVNGDVKKAVCYPGDVLQVNGNVDEFIAEYTADDSAFPVFAVTGKVKKANVKYTESPHKVATIYNVKEGKFVSSTIGGVWIAASDYSLTPSNDINDKKDGEYDDVPKTGYGLAGSAIFFLLAAACAIAGVVIKKKNYSKEA